MAELIGTASPIKNGLMGTNFFHIDRSLPSSTKADDAVSPGIYRINGGATGFPNGNYGILIVFASKDSINTSVAQIFFGANTSSVWFRNRWTPTQSWEAWASIS